MSIKSRTIAIIEEVLKQQKKYYRSQEFYFPVHKNGYSTHQGAVLRHYLRDHGYVTVRVSEISKQFFVDNQDSINASLKGKPINEVLLKSTNSIIIKAEDYLKYKKNMFTAVNFNKNVKTFENIFQPSKLNDNTMVLLPPMHHDIPTRRKPGLREVAVIGMGIGNMGKEVLTLEQDKKSVVLKALILKYSERLKNLKTYDSECGESLGDTERHDLEQRIRDHAEIVRDLKSIQ